ncbi:hypothetical protein VC279_13015 [Xanthomonas sp. WHRI 10064A]|uniref:hypothetical protein n=1 Tax=Xanthomonas TaxID=338 RepID=UPI002B22D209|nr:MULTISPECIES: hypothetical protein [Xanthomonas]MEA9578264.1 hypothetical protein [Xanthomonas nasturtii]MEA9587879.1 hypothetical protein [Xanthomonas sp. WHRI 10064B]MEA9615601.1 hypothetical protein [Xanthomonas sp. WHRI 10064A]
MLVSTTGEAAIICQFPAQHRGVRAAARWAETKRAGNAGSLVAVMSILADY